MSPAPAISCRALDKRYTDAVALRGFDLEVEPGTILGLLGPSGCGKTTALRLIAGFERPDAGEISIAGNPVVADGVWVPPESRRVGMVFQDYALFPHMTVHGNVSYGLATSESGRVSGVLEMVGLDGYRDRMPHELSGGEQQRVALARALAPRPEVIMLDEPFSNLDAGLRDRMRRDVRAILANAGTTTIFVTHDQEEALAMADIVAVMQGGRVLQTAAPDILYRRPATPWVAGFVGDSEFVSGEAELGRVTTPLGVFPHSGNERGRVLVMIRPEWIHVTPSLDGVAVVVDREFYGHDQMLKLEFADGREITSRIGDTRTVGIGDRVDIGVEELVVFPDGPDLPAPARARYAID